MLSFIVVLHSTTGEYSDTLLADATRASTAVSRSVSGSSPDFVPSMTVFRTDPVAGCQCLYQSVIPDRNHAVSQSTALLRAPGSASWLADNGHVKEGTAGGVQTKTEVAEDEGSWSCVRSFRARSALYLQECIGALAGKVDDSAADTASRRAWSCLAGALFIVLCYVNRHGLSASAAVDASASLTTSETTASGVTARTVVLIFSDGDASSSSSSSSHASPCFSFADECAFAVAAVQLAKSDVPVFCFGSTVSSSQSTTQTEAASGGARLRALTASLGGFAAPRFSWSHVGALLDTHMSTSAASEAAHNRTGQPGKAASRMPADVLVHDVDAPPDPLSATKQRRRERLVDHYCIQPIALPLEGMSAAADSASSETAPGQKRKRSARREAPPAPDVPAASYLAWLCPHCTAIVHRAPSDALVGSATPTCPYCVDSATK